MTVTYNSEKELQVALNDAPPATFTIVAKGGKFTLIDLT
jgi:hypothetical protein